MQCGEEGGGPDDPGRNVNLPRPCCTGHFQPAEVSKRDGRLKAGREDRLKTTLLNRVFRGQRL